MAETLTDSFSAAPSRSSASRLLGPARTICRAGICGPLVDAPRFTGRNWFAMLGPGLLMGGSAIGGGEWLMGRPSRPRYGGALMWLATLSILGQVIYNLEISRYTLYTGEPIFTGKFRTLPGPRFWLTAYLILDFGSVFPYLAANAATPLAAVILGRFPSPPSSGPRCIFRPRPMC